MLDLDEFLGSRVEREIVSLIRVLCDCTAAVSEILATTPVDHVGTANKFGDQQLTVDVDSDAKIFELLATSGLVSHAASEEEPEMRRLSQGGKFIVCSDPLDGSSIIDCNWSVGSIFGAWKCGGSGSLIGRTGRDQVLAAMAVYGPRTTLICATDDLVFELTKMGSNEWKVSSSFSACIRPTAKIFSPANLRAAQDLPGYSALVDEWMRNRLTLRYTGGMVPDVASILTKKNGIFCSPVSEKAPAKLRLVFECAPIAKIIETAGGKALSGRTENESILDIKIRSMDDRVGIVCGSSDEVDKAVARVVEPAQRVISSGA